MEKNKIKAKIETNIAYVMISNPPVNALSTSTMKELEGLIDQLAENNAVSCIVLSGTENFFSAGADIKEFTYLIDDPEKAEKAALKGQSFYSKIEQLQKPVIAAINGTCLGGGLELALSCHMRIAAENALLGLPEMKLGLMPGYGGTQRLARLTTTAKALELILTADFITGKEAEKIGLVNFSVKESKLMEKASDLAKSIAAKSDTATQAVLYSVFKGMQLPAEKGLALEAKQFGALFKTGESKEGITAFIEKRLPSFKKP